MTNTNEKTGLTEQEFFKALAICGDAALNCRLRQIRAFGAEGLTSTFSVSSAAQGKPSPIPSIYKILDTMDWVLKQVDKALNLGPIFRIYKTGFKLVYKPHFKILNDLEESINKYWNPTEFLFWSMEATTNLERKIAVYTKTTGYFDIKSYLRYLNKPSISEAEKNEALSHLQIVATILSDFDYKLLSDLENLVNTLIGGMTKVLELSQAKNITDGIALLELKQKLTLLFINIDSNSLAEAVSNLRSHFNSWRLIDGKQQPYPDFNSEIADLKHKFDEAIRRLDQLTNFGNQHAK